MWDDPFVQDLLLSFSDRTKLLILLYAINLKKWSILPKNLVYQYAHSLHREEIFSFDFDFRTDLPFEQRFGQLFDLLWELSLEKEPEIIGFITHPYPNAIKSFSEIESLSHFIISPKGERSVKELIEDYSEVKMIVDVISERICFYDKISEIKLKE